MYEYPANVVDIYDGDSVKLLVDLGFNRTLSYPKPAPFRLYGIDTPEVNPSSKTEPDPEIRALHKKAGVIVRDWLRREMLGKDVVIKTYKPDPKDKYGRFLAEFFVDGNLVNEELVELRYAHLYDGGTKSKWTREELQFIIASVS